MLKYQQLCCNLDIRSRVGLGMSTSPRFHSRRVSNRMAYVALMLGVATASAVAQDASSSYAASTPEDSVRAVELARGEALLHADTVALSRMIAPEFIEISRLGQLRPRAVNLREIATGELR